MSKDLTQLNNLTTFPPNPSFHLRAHINLHNFPMLVSSTTSIRVQTDSFYMLPTLGGRKLNHRPLKYSDSRRCNFA